MTILGVDPGLSRTGWVMVDGSYDEPIITASGILTASKWANKKKGIKTPLRIRVDMITNKLLTVVHEHKPDYIAIEDFVFFQNMGRTSSDMPILIESIRKKLHNGNYNIDIYPNNMWKRLLLKNGIASKKQIKHFLDNHLGYEFPDKEGHKIDAICIALTKLYLLEQEQVFNSPLKKG